MRTRRSVALRFLGVNPGRIGFKGELALLDRLLGRLPAVRVERVTLSHLGEPVAQLDQVDLVLLEFGVSEVVLRCLLYTSDAADE